MGRREQCASDLLEGCRVTQPTRNTPRERAYRAALKKDAATLAEIAAAVAGTVCGGTDEPEGGNGAHQKHRPLNLLFGEFRPVADEIIAGAALLVPQFWRSNAWDRLKRPPLGFDTCRSAFQFKS